ncbi:hypothetical protein A2997_01295 [Candidatus Nomurabacteria bacterium RIFCSPLOWO2_01_FULL_36_10b]|uniref:D-lactate dehydrogenase (cytochrome) n=1 Tax=Candidatus Nomurabacteria bacterium RIFCSPLOWO2_01_FULL_36_10b TaxID=1801766 RepID=A0A1F6WQU5_9BACT|nr:MAG: hypothetical protein A2997_01295 [Candidatus Nomurabacteria bacterium RIFCSPLOWO2_01_FULL_36_10b]
MVNDLLERYSTDWSLFTIHPSDVIAPKNSQEIGEIVKHISAEKKKKNSDETISITARAAGTDMTGGPLNHGTILDMTQYMRGVIDIKEGDFGAQTSYSNFKYVISGHITALPGTYYRDLEKLTLAKGLLMPCYPASKNLCAIGGMVANNGAGERSIKYGQNKDFVSEIKAVLYDGNEYIIRQLTKEELDAKIMQDDFEGKLYKEAWELVRDNDRLINTHRPMTTKNSAGYLLWDVIKAPSVDAFINGEGVFDMTKFFVGAQGTTGIITEITYKLVKYEKFSDLLLIYVQDIEKLPILVKQLMKSDLEMLEMYDDHTLRVGIRFFADFIKDRGVLSFIKYIIRFIPEFWMALIGGIPKFVVMAEFVSDNENELRHEVRDAKERIADLNLKTKIITKSKDEEKFWDFRHDSFKILTEHTLASRGAGTGTRTAPFIDDIAVNPEYLPDYIPRLVKILNEYDILYTIAGHLGNGNFHIIPLIDMSLEENRKKILEITDKVYTLALEYHGTITAEHNDGIIRTPYLEQMFGPSMVALFSKVKRIFDPLNIFNPGKKVGMTKEDIMRYME